MHKRKERRRKERETQNKKGRENNRGKWKSVLRENGLDMGQLFKLKRNEMKEGKRDEEKQQLQQ